MAESTLLLCLLLLIVAFIVWCAACACLLAVSRLLSRTTRATAHGTADAWHWADVWVRYALTELGPIDADPDLYAARAAAADHHRITVDRDGRRVEVSA